MNAIMKAQIPESQTHVTQSNTYKICAAHTGSIEMNVNILCRRLSGATCSYAVFAIFCGIDIMFVRESLYVFPMYSSLLFYLHLLCENYDYEIEIKVYQQ